MKGIVTFLLMLISLLSTAQTYTINSGGKNLYDDSYRISVGTPLDTTDYFYPNTTGTSYYLSDYGNDANTGLSPTNAWRSIAKLNTKTLTPGDSIFFRCRSTFAETQLIVNQSGNSTEDIVFKTYSAGAKPKISGFNTPTSWSFYSTGIYRTFVSAANSGLNDVLLDGEQQRIGRYPNFSASNEGYLPYVAASGSSSAGASASITTSAALATNWVGAEIAIRVKNWVINRGVITGQSGTSVTYTNPPVNSYIGAANFGFFIQKDLRTLDTYGEWYFDDATGYLYVYFGAELPTAHEVKVSVVDTLVKTNSASYLVFNNLQFEGGNTQNMYINNGHDHLIKNCNLQNGGKTAAYVFNTYNTTYDSCIVRDNLGAGLYLKNSGAGVALNLNVTNSDFYDTETYAGMGISGDLISTGGRTHVTIWSAYSNTTMNRIANNRFVKSGYAAVEVVGSYITVENNFVDSCAIIKDDVGGIYSFNSFNTHTAIAGATLSSNMIIRNNIIQNVIGNVYGTSAPAGKGRGIYLDNGSNNFLVYGNTISNCTLAGIYMNDPWNNTYRDNTIFNCGTGWQVNRFKDGDTIAGVKIVSNRFYPYTSLYTDLAIDQPTLRNTDRSLSNGLTLDSSYYYVDPAAAACSTFVRWYNSTNTVSANHNISYLTGLGEETHAHSLSFTSTDDLVLFYNASNSTTVTPLSGAWDDDTGTPVTTLTLLPYKSKVLRSLSSP